MHPHVPSRLMLAASIAASVILSPAVRAKEQPRNFEELLELDLEALLDVKVTVASARPEAVRNTPVVVSRLNAEEARRYGLRTLAEWLSLLPGVVVQETAIGTQAVMMRGLVEGFNQKVLFLLDGVPYWQPSHGDIPLAAIPLELIAHVEVVRGPGGVLFGTNATAGVINVVTRRENDGIALLELGDRSRWRGEGYWHRGDNGRGLTLAVSASDGPEYLGTFTARPVPPSFPADTPREGEVPRNQRQASAFVAWRGANGSLRWHGFESDTRGLAAAATLLNTSHLRYRGQQLAGDYLWTITPRQEVRAVLDWTQYSLSIPTDLQINGITNTLQTFRGNDGDNRRVRSTLNWQWEIADERYLQAGLEREVRHHGDYFVIERDTGRMLGQQMANGSTGESAAYAQADLRWGDWRTVFGLRQVDSDAFGSATLPRGALIWQPSAEHTWRLGWAEGYNTPTPIQRYIRVAPDALVGNPALNAESIRNIELGWSWQQDEQAISITAYRMAADNAIRRIRPVGSGTVTFINVPRFNRHGVEAEWRVQRGDWNAYATVHWQREGDSDLDEFSRFAPRWQSSIGLSHNLGNHQLGGSLRHIGERAAASPINLLALHYRYDADAWAFEAALDNVLGDSVRHADVLDLVEAREVAGAPASTGVRLGWRWRF